MGGGCRHFDFSSHRATICPGSISFSPAPPLCKSERRGTDTFEVKPEGLVGVGHDDRPVGNQAEAPDGVPGQGVLTTEVEDTTVTQLHRRLMAWPKALSPMKTPGSSSRSRGGVQGLVDLRGLDEHAVVQTADLTEGEVAGGGVLRDLDELRRVTQSAGLRRGDEGDVGLTEPRHVLRGQRQDGVLDDRRGEVVRPGRDRWSTWPPCRCRTATGSTEASGWLLAVPEDHRAGQQQGVPGRVVEVLGHVTAEQTRGRGHDVVEGRVQQQLGDRDGEALLGNGDARTARRSGRPSASAHLQQADWRSAGCCSA